MDEKVYPVASEEIAFGSPIVINGGFARLCLPEEMHNGHAVNPSFKGRDTAYHPGQTIRALPLIVV